MIKDLIESESEDGFWFSSWECDDYVHITWGLVTLAIPIEEWKSFSNAVIQTTFKRTELNKRKSNKDTSLQ